MNLGARTVRFGLYDDGGEDSDSFQIMLPATRRSRLSPATPVVARMASRRGRTAQRAVHPFRVDWAGIFQTAHSEIMISTAVPAEARQDGSVCNPHLFRVDLGRGVTNSNGLQAF